MTKENERGTFLKAALQHNENVIQKMSQIIDGFVQEQQVFVDLNYDDVATSLAYCESGIDIAEKMLTIKK
jgi:hypothetical protein